MPPSLRGAKRRSNLPAIGPPRHCERSEATRWLTCTAVIASAAKQPPSNRAAPSLRAQRSNLLADGQRRHCERSEATCWLMGNAVIASAAKQPPLIRVFIKSNMNVNNSSGTKVFCLSPAG